MSSIEFEICPVEEATDALMESITSAFSNYSDKEAISPLLESEIDRFFNELNEDCFCLIEYPYVDKVYRDSYYTYYASKHGAYPRDCIRVSIFLSEITPETFLNAEKHGDLQSIYGGFISIRPTRDDLFGRSLLSPAIFKDNGFKISACNVITSVLGAKLSVSGFPHSSQDGETIKCAETTIWGIMEYFGNRYPEYMPTLPSKIHAILRPISYQRQLPSNGLSVDEISFGLKQFGFGTRIYSREPYSTEIFNIIRCYVESGIPVIIGLETQDIGHVVIACGHEQDAEFSGIDQLTPTSYNVAGEQVLVYDTSDLHFNIVVQDDNLLPYRQVDLSTPGKHYEDSDMKGYEIDSIVVPLYPKIYLECVVAKQLAIQVLKDRTFGVKCMKEIVFRFFLTSGRSLKRHFTRQDMSHDLKSALLLTRLPKFVWCAELYSMDGIKGFDKKACGLILLDATEANEKSLDALIFAGYIDRCIVKNDNNFVALPTTFADYRYFSNLQ